MSKFNAKYLLNNGSHKKIKKNLSKDLNYLKEIPEELLLAGEDDGAKLSENGILQYAFKIGLRIENVPQKLLKNIKIRNKIIHQSIIQQENIIDIVNILKSKGRGNKQILEILSDSSKDLIAKNPILFEQLLTYSGTQSLQVIVEKFFTNDELNEMFKEKELPEKVLRLKEIYENYPKMLEYISSKLLLPQYKKISLHKLQLIVRIPEMRFAITNMNNYELELYGRMSNNISEASNGWQEF